MPDFWLVSTIQDCKVDTTREIARAKVFTKWHFVDENFLEKVRDGRRSLSNWPNGDTPDGRNEMTDRLASGKPIIGVNIDDSKSDYPSETFPVNIDGIFSNGVGLPERISNLCWISYNVKSQVVSVQLAFHIEVNAPMRLHEYPYDRHVIPFHLDTRRWKDESGKDDRWTLLKSVPHWAPAKYSEDRTILSEKLTSHDAEFWHLQSNVYFGREKNAKPLLCIHVQRNPANFVARVTFPVFIVVSVAISVFFISGRTAEMEFNAALTSLLTLTAFSFAVQSALPKLPYMTLGDKYFVVPLDCRTCFHPPTDPYPYA